MKSPEAMILRGVRVASLVLLGLLLLFLVAGIGMAYQAQRNARTMESCEWIHNDRCLAKVAELPEPDRGFKFAVFGDVQYGTAQLPHLMKALKAEGPVDFIIQTGDAVAHADAGHYILFLSELARSGLRLPMFVVPGNHDVGRTRERGPLFERYFGPRNFWFEYGGVLFVIIDNSLGPLDDAQYRRLENVLEKNKANTRRTFLFAHRQPINWEGDDERPFEQKYERLLGILDRHSVDYMFAGHWHGYHREERNATVFVVNGRGGDFDHDEPLAPCYFTVVDVQGDSVRDKRIDLPPHISYVVRGRLKKLFVVRIGWFMMENPFLSSCIVLPLGLLFVFLIVWRKKRSA